MNLTTCTITCLLSLFFAPPEKSDAPTPDYVSEYVDIQGSSKAVQTLWLDTQEKHVAQVRDYVEGKKEFDSALITQETLYSYLAAAKIVDLTLPLDQQKNSTIFIRELCFREPETLRAGKQITLLNAYSIPPLNEERLEFANRLNALEREPRVQQENYARKELRFHRDAIPRIHAVFQKAMATLDRSTALLSTKGKHFYFSGASGSGKTFQLSQFVQSLGAVSPKSVIYGTDNFKSYLREEFTDCGDFQSFVMAIALRKEMESYLKTHSNQHFFLQEGVLVLESDVRALFEETQAPVEIRDSDAPFRSIALRALNRALKQEGVYLTFDHAVKNVSDTRELRKTLIEQLRPQDTYVMNYDGALYSPEQMKELAYQIPDGNLQETGNDLITAEDVQKYGEMIKPYQGMTIRTAMDQAAINAKIGAK